MFWLLNHFPRPMMISVVSIKSSSADMDDFATTELTLVGNLSGAKAQTEVTSSVKVAVVNFMVVRSRCDTAKLREVVVCQVLVQRKL